MSISIRGFNSFYSDNTVPFDVQVKNVVAQIYRPFFDDYSINNVRVIHVDNDNFHILFMLEAYYDLDNNLDITLFCSYDVNRNITVDDNIIHKVYNINDNEIINQLCDFSW